MAKLFGTDGIRAPADERLIALAREVGFAVARACGEGALGAASDRPRVVVGRDTRTSGPAVEDALVEGLTGAGAVVLRGGVLPTGAVAYATSILETDAGVVISASHNPPGDNGIKVFGPGGWKVSGEAEDRIESLVGDGGRSSSVGTEERVDVFDGYVDHLVASVGSDLKDMRVVIDCAEGAASSAAPAALARLSAGVVALRASGDGARINDGCGATHPDFVADAARREGLVGLTFDGDADRVLCADETGEIVDGDAIIALIAGDLLARGELASGSIAVTVMANQALRTWCDAAGIKIVETPVGDRNVLETMRALGLVLGGEQAGHILRLDRATTGDGILIGLNVLDILASTGGRLADLVPFRPMPQVLVNVRWPDGRHLDDRRDLAAAIDEAQRALGSRGRVLVRRSGTEPLVRVMVEAPDRATAGEVAESVADVLRRSLEETA